MLIERTTAPPAVYFIADHLDAVLAAGEDVRRLHVEIPPAMSGLDVHHAQALRQFVEQIHRHELTILLHLIEARRRVLELADSPKMLRLILGLFTGGTAALADAAAECGDPADFEFSTSGDPLDYLRTRGLLPPDCGSLVGRLQVEASEAMLVASRLPLGDILDHAAGVLDALDVCFDLYSEATEEAGVAVDSTATLLTPTPV